MIITLITLLLTFGVVFISVFLFFFLFTFMENIFESKNKTSLKFKITLAIGITFVALLSVAEISNYMIDEQFLKVLEMVSLPFVLWIFLFGIVVVWKLRMMTKFFPFGDSIITQKLASFPQRLFLTFGMLCITIIPFVAISKGIPTVIHFIDSKPFIIKVEVKGKRANYKDRRCIGGIYYKDKGSLINRSICGIRREDWERVFVGDMIILEGRKSLMAFETVHYKLLK